MATNMTVLEKVEKMWDPITVRRYQGWTPSAGNIITVDCAIRAAKRRATKAQHQT